MAEPSSVTEPGAATTHEHRNTLSLKAAYAYHVLAPRESGVSGTAAPEREHLGGFSLAYERTLVPGWLALEVAKPFYFAPGRFDSPFDTSLKLLHRWGPVEPFVAAGITFNIRVFDDEREEIEGRANELSFGLVATVGAVVWLTKRWAIEVEGSYEWIPAGAVVNHELGATIGPLIGF